MKKLCKLIIITLIFTSTQLAGAVATENEYGSVKAWFNGQEATVKNLQLKIGEPADIKVIVTSNISGNVYVELENPLVTEPYQVLNGPSMIGKTISNSGVSEGWSQTYVWTITPNGAWKNGNAPINIFVSFSKKGNQKPIEFTLADPYILDEQYSGTTPARTTGAVQPSPTGTSSEPKQAPFLTASGAIALMLGVWMWKRGSTT